MTKINDYVFVLWGYNFNETTATALVTQLRKAGLLVKVVDLSPGQIDGAHKLALVPDLILDRALLLATQTICVIIPSAGYGLIHLRNNPRLTKFLTQVQANRAKFVIGPVTETDILDLTGLAIPPEQLIVYPAEADLPLFAQELARMLVTTPP